MLVRDLYEVPTILSLAVIVLVLAVVVVASLLKRKREAPLDAETTVDE
jgi:hypothetical protein